MNYRYFYLLTSLFLETYFPKLKTPSWDGNCFERNYKTFKQLHVFWFSCSKVTWAFFLDCAFQVLIGWAHKFGSHGTEQRNITWRVHCIISVRIICTSVCHQWTGYPSPLRMPVPFAQEFICWCDALLSSFPSLFHCPAQLCFASVYNAVAEG